jgi:hypothetical protein
VCRREGGEGGEMRGGTCSDSVVLWKEEGSPGLLPGRSEGIPDARFINGDLNIYLVPLLDKASRLTRSIAGRNSLAPGGIHSRFVFSYFLPSIRRAPARFHCLARNFRPTRRQNAAVTRPRRPTLKGLSGLSLSPLASSVPRVSRVLPWPLTRA